MTISYPRFHAPRWARNSHLQTILPRMLFPNHIAGGDWQDFVTNDGDIIELTWFTGGVEDPKGIVCVFHGLEGSVNSHYITTLVPELAQHYWIVVVHFRGCGRQPNKLPRSYHSGDTEDALAVVRSVKLTSPDLPTHAVGYSLGGNMLLKLLGENNAESVFDSAVVVSPPFDLAKCSTSISKGFSRVYERHLLKSMRRQFLEKAKRHNYQALLNLSDDKINSLNSFWAFDEYITGPLHGFSGAKDYYSKSSAIGYMKQIKTRTLVLHSYDDPFMSRDIVPDRSQISEYVHLELSEHGGHVGFLQGTPWKPTLWLPGRIAHYLHYSI